MIDLLGLKMAHPIITSSGPLSGSEKGIDGLLEAGAAAVTTKTIFNGILAKKGCVDKNIWMDNLFFNQEGFSERPIEYWHSILPKYEDRNLIVSIGAQSMDDIVTVSEDAVRHGARVIELCLSCPNSTQEPICFSINDLQKICIEVRKKIHIPILAKITITPIKKFNREIVKVIEGSGIDGITVTDTLPSIFMSDGYKRFGGLSGAFLKPLVLKFLDDIQDINVCKIAVGGVCSGQDVFEYVQYGATAVGICSTLIKNGLQHINKIFTEYCTISK